MNMNEAIRALWLLFPDMEVGTDNDGQIIVYTGTREGADGTLVPFADEVTA